MKHVEYCQSKYAPGQIFDLVADVERYPRFVPWVKSAKVIRRRESTIWTELTMGVSVLCQRFTTVAELDRPGRIDVNSPDPMFERFEQIWLFNPAAEGTNIEYRVDLKLRSAMMGAVVTSLFSDGARSMVNAYMREAERAYGRAKIAVA